MHHWANQTICWAVAPENNSCNEADKSLNIGNVLRDELRCICSKGESHMLTSHPFYLLACPWEPLESGTLQSSLKAFWTLLTQSANAATGGDLKSHYEQDITTAAGVLAGDHEE